MSTALVQRLKDGIQDAVVFLRTLEQFKIPAVVQRRANTLLEKLEALQTDSIRCEPPPHFDGDAEETAQKDKKEEPAKTKEAAKATEPAKTKEAAKATEPAKTKEPAKAKEPAKTKEPAKAKEPAKTKEPAKAKEPAKTKVPAKPKEPAKAKEPTKTEEATPQVDKKSTSNKAKTKSVQISVKSNKSEEAAPPPSQPEAEDHSIEETEKPVRKRDSRSILNRVKELEELDRAAKREQAAYEEFKYGPSPKLPDQVASDVSKESVETPEHQASPEPVEPKVELREKSQLKAEDVGDKRSSAGSFDKEPDGVSMGGGEEDGLKEEKKTKKKGFGKFLKVGSKSKSRDKSPAPSAGEEVTDAPEEPKETGGEKGLPSRLEKRMKRFGAHHWVKQTVTLDGTLLIMLGDKNKEDRMQLVGCTVGTMEIANSNAFEVVNHPEHRQLVFRVETAEGREQWINALQAAIEECNSAYVVEHVETPTEEPEVEAVPTIEVEEPQQDGESPEHNKKCKEGRPSSSKTSKMKQEMPELGVVIKGSVQRKTGWSRWEKTWCVVTYDAIYYTSQEDNKEYSHFTPIVMDPKNSVHERKGAGNHPGLMIKIAGKKEHISFESASEAKEWREKFEQVLGISGVGELLSEDEDEGEPEIEEDLYEEVNEPPPVSSSYRIPSVTEELEDMGGEDIYEEFDDNLPSPSSSLPPSLPPNHPKSDVSPASSLPPTLPPNHPKAQAAEPPPSLPPRSPLPSRGIPNKPNPPPAQTYEVEAASKASRPPPPAAEDDELYDDVVVCKTLDEVEETYDDVTSPIADAVEEDYDDVVTTTSPASELYEDMTPGEDGPQGDYVVMEPGQEDSDGELYCEVDEPLRHTGKKISVPDKGGKEEKGTTFSRVFKNRQGTSSSSSARGSHSGQLTYLPPGKSKSKDQWCIVDDNQLQLYKNPSDKRPQDKLTLKEFDLEGRTDGGQFSFVLRRGTKEHRLTAGTKEELSAWLSALKGLVKSAVLNLESAVRTVYMAKEDHIAEDDSQLTFKKGTFILLVTEVDEDVCIGQLGNKSQEFDGKIGKFPTNKVEIAEDLYI